MRRLNCEVLRDGGQWSEVGEPRHCTAKEYRGGESGMPELDDITGAIVDASKIDPV